MNTEDRALLVRKLRALADSIEGDENYTPGLYAYTPSEGYTLVSSPDEARKVASPPFEDDPEVDSHEWGVLVTAEVARVTIQWVTDGVVMGHQRKLLDTDTYAGPWKASL